MNNYINNHFILYFVAGALDEKQDFGIRPSLNEEPD
jgi:hypothetical protein